MFILYQNLIKQEIRQLKKIALLGNWLAMVLLTTILCWILHFALIDYTAKTVQYIIIILIYSTFLFNIGALINKRAHNKLFFQMLPLSFRQIYLAILCTDLFSLKNLFPFGALIVMVAHCTHTVSLFIFTITYGICMLFFLNVWIQNLLNVLIFLKIGNKKIFTVLFMIFSFIPPFMKKTSINFELFFEKIFYYIPLNYFHYIITVHQNNLKIWFKGFFFMILIFILGLITGYFQTKFFLKKI